VNDSEFSDLVDTIVEQIEDELDEWDDDLDIDSSAGILNVAFPDGSAVILSRQIVNHEIWIAARSGGFHLGFIDDQWLCRTTSELLPDLLSRVFSEQIGRTVRPMP
jgi:CyaY protein